MSTFLFNNANYSRTQPHRKLNTCRSNNITIKLNTKHMTSGKLGARQVSFIRSSLHSHANQPQWWDAQRLLLLDYWACPVQIVQCLDEMGFAGGIGAATAVNVVGEPEMLSNKYIFQSRTVWLIPSCPLFQIFFPFVFFWLVGRVIIR